MLRRTAYLLAAIAVVVPFGASAYELPEYDERYDVDAIVLPDYDVRLDLEICGKALTEKECNSAEFTRKSFCGRLALLNDTKNPENKCRQYCEPGNVDPAMCNDTEWLGSVCGKFELERLNEAHAQKNPEGSVCYTRMREHQPNRSNKIERLMVKSRFVCNS